MWMLLLGLWAGATDPVCERTSWRRQTAELARDENTAEALNTIVSATSTGTKQCPKREFPAQCLADGAVRARSGSVAFQLLIDAVREAQQHDDIGTLLTERAQAALGRRVAGTGSVVLQRRGLDSTGEADLVLERVPGQLILRTQADADVFRAEAVWMDAARDWNGARCACDAVCVPPPASMGRQLTRLRALRGALVDAQQTLLTRFSLDALTERIVQGGAGDVGEELLLSRAAALQRALAENGARPHAARQRVTAVIATLDGHNVRGTDAQSTLISWLMYDRAWRRHYRRMDTHIDRIIAAWVRVDQAEGKTALDVANSRLERSFRLLKESNPGTPSTMRVR